MIPEGFITSLLDRADIVDVVGRYVTLKKGGRNFMACCPFHKEKTPSFSVSPSKQIFKCFGCGQAGNAIGFLMEMERLSFPEAVRRLAEIYGMEVPEDRSPARREARRRAKSLSDYMREAADFYTDSLGHSKKAIEYLRQREITGETAARFGLGYSPDGWHGLMAVFPGEKYLARELVETGLVLEKSGRRYDAFRDRIMFPIRSPKGTVIGFGARTMKGDEQPKYLNSPETPIYHKGSELYGLFEARSSIIDKGRAIVCEGYMDVIQLSQAGFRETVAALGTSITPEHVKKLFKLSDSVYFSFDGDSAGRKAARRALEAALPVIADGQAAHFVLLPPEHDPDSLVKAEGPEGYEREIGKAPALTEFLKSLILEGRDLVYAEERAKLAADAKPLILSMKNAPVLRLALVRDVAALARVPLEDLQAQWGIAPGERAGAMPPDPGFASAPSFRRSEGLRFPSGGRFLRGRDGFGASGFGWGGRFGAWQRRPAPEPRIGVQDVRDRMLQCFLAYPELLSEFSPQIEDEFVTSPSPAAGRIVEVWRAALAESDEEGGRDSGGSDASGRTNLNPAALLMRLADSPESARYESLLAGELTLETPEQAARLEVRRDFLDLELERVKARLLALGSAGAELGQLRALARRRAELERMIAEAAEEERAWRRTSENARRTSAFAEAEAGKADIAYSSNPKVRALQEHLFGKAALATRPQAAPSAPAVQASPFGRPPGGAAAASPFGAAPTVPSVPSVPAARSASAAPASAFGAPPPAPFDASGAVGASASSAALAAQPAFASSALSAEPAASAPKSAARARRDAIAAALLAQAEKRMGARIDDPDRQGESLPDDPSAPPAASAEMPEGFDAGLDDAELAGLADEAALSADFGGDELPPDDPV